MTTKTELINWLKNPNHIRTVLVVVDGVLGAPSPTFYLSNRAYTSTGSDSPAHQYFDPCITGGISFSESLNIEGNSSSISYGDIEIDNTNGIRDTWLDYIWTNKSITVLIGDPRWNYDDFYTIFVGTVADILSRDRNSINLLLVDKSQKLNNPISESTFSPFGGDITEELTPQTFGECFNISPIQSNSAKLEYIVHTDPIERIIEVRDNGLPVQFYEPGEIVEGSTGNYEVPLNSFALVNSPYGQITCSVQGHKNTTYYNTAPDLIKEILTQIVPSNIRLNLSDINLINFSTVAALRPYPLGIYITSETNAWDVCNQLASSIGHQLVFDTNGQLNLIPLDLSGNNLDTYYINKEDIEFQSLSISEKLVVKGSIKIAYCKNWTVQESGLSGGVPTEHVQLFDTEWLYQSYSNQTTIDNYSLVDNSEPIDTFLLRKLDAIAEANRLGNLFSGKHYIYTMVGYPHMLPLNLGDNVILTHNRYGLDNGAAGVVVSIARDWISGRATIGVLI